LRFKLQRNFVVLPQGRGVRHGDVLLIRLPADEVAKHLGIYADGPYEPMLVHAFNGWSSKKVIEEPLRRWEGYVVEGYRFPQLCTEEELSKWHS